SSGGPEASFFMNVEEFGPMVSAVRAAEKAIGPVVYNLTEKQEIGRDYSRSLDVVADIVAGVIITSENVLSTRSGFCVHQKCLKVVLGKAAKRDLVRGERFDLNMI